MINNGIKKHELDFIVTRGCGGGSMKAGGYTINKAYVEHAKNYQTPHASSLGPIVTYALMQELGIPGYTYDSEGVDEFCDFARLSGLKEFPIAPGSHTLNAKAAARKAAKLMGGRYEDYCLIVCHLGGGTSTSMHIHGRLADSKADAYGPERSGGMPRLAMVGFTRGCYSGKYTLEQMLKLQMGKGGLMSYLGTSDLREVEKRIESGDKEAKFYFEGMLYQIACDIGAMSTTVKGNVDAIIFTGGMAYSQMLTEELKDRVEFIAPVICVPGSHEMQALAEGALRVVRGEEPVHEFGI